MSRRALAQVRYSLTQFIPFSSISLPCTGNDLAQIETSEDHVNFFDGSGTIFNIYTKLTEQDDNKLVHRLQNDADRILIFVSIYIGLHTASQFPTRNL
jgi:hypothetical protein